MCIQLSQSFSVLNENINVIDNDNYLSNKKQKTVIWALKDK